MSFKPATRQAVKLKLGLMGPSGSGKTFSADRLAAGLCPGGKIAFLDTENGSGSLYADRFAFDVMDMHQPFTVAKFMAAIDEAVKAGYDVLIIDSISAEWQELLSEKEMLDARGGNSFTNWGAITKKHEDFKKAFLQAPIHIIACMRSKQEYVLQTNDKGKQAPVKMGMGAVQREGFEYECSIVFDIDMQHNAKASKDRSSLFDDTLFLITEETGKTIREWLMKGGEPVPEVPAAQAQPAAAPGRPTQAPVPAASPAPTAPSSAAPAAQIPPTPPGRRTRTQAAPSAQPPAPSGDYFRSHPDWEPFVEAMVDLAQVTVGMPAQTRNALCAQFDKEGPTSLAALRAEIASIKSVMNPEAPGGAFTGMTPPARGPVSQEASDFVDGIADGPQGPDTDEAAGGISKDQYELLNRLIKAHGINRDSLRVYCSKLNQLLPGANGPTLARMTAQAFTKLREDLQNPTPEANGKTWSQVRIDRINATPATPYTPPQSA